MGVFGTVILPLDGSRLAETAIPFAVLLARASEAEVIVARVAERRGPSGDEIMAALRPAVERISAAGVPARAVARAGEPDVELVALASEHERPVIVLASHGRSGLQRVVVGSVATRVVQRATCPVLVVRAFRDRPPGETVQLQRISVPLDGTELSERGLPIALALARSTGARVHLVRVAQTYRDEVPEGPDRFLDPADQQALLDDFRRLENETRAYLARLVARLQDQGVVVTWEALSGDPWRQLRRYLESDDPDLVVMTTHGRAGIARWVYGSIADRILTEADVPVLLIRSTDEEE